MFYLLSLSLIIFSSSSPYSSRTLLDDDDDDSTVDEMAERYKVGVNAREGENVARKRRGYRERKEDTRRGEEEEGPAFQSPVSTRDPRPLNHPPQLGRNSVLFSPLLCSFLLFSSLRVSVFFFFFYLSPLPFSTFSTGPRRQPTDPPPPPPSSSSPTSANVPPARSDGRELWEKRRRPARPLRG